MTELERNALGRVKTLLLGNISSIFVESRNNWWLHTADIRELVALAERTEVAERAAFDAEKKRVAMAESLTVESKALREERLKLAMVRTDRGGVWLWQGDGHDDIASLTCPVVMSADTLRSIIAERDAALAKLAPVAAPACQHAGTMGAADCVFCQKAKLEKQLAEVTAQRQDAQRLIHEGLEALRAKNAERDALSERLHAAEAKLKRVSEQLTKTTDALRGAAQATLEIIAEFARSRP